VFWTKIWLFLLTAVVGVLLVLALALPRPVERRVHESEDMRLVRARLDVERLLQIDARTWVDVALAYGLAGLDGDLRRLRDTAPDTIPTDIHTAVQGNLRKLVEGTKVADKIELAVALDAWGRVIARVGVDENDWGDDLSGWFLVRDALRGYMRDDLWLIGDKLYRVAAAPILTRAETGDRAYVGAVIIGQAVDDGLTKTLERNVSSSACAEGNCDTHVAFFALGKTIANSGPTTLSGDIKTKAEELEAELDQRDKDGRPKGVAPFTVAGEGAEFRVAIRRLPGEVSAQDGYYAVYSVRPRATGFIGSLQGLAKQDISFDNFPWIAVAGGFLLVLLGGLALSWAEVDRPLKRLLGDALALGKGDTRQFTEDQHKGKFGGIARSANLAIDRLNREITAARVDAADSARELPTAGPLGPMAGVMAPPSAPDFSLDPPPPPPPSMPHGGGFEFEIPPPPTAAPPGPPALPRTPRPLAEDLLPPPRPTAAPRPPAPPPTPPPSRPTLDDDILGGQVTPPPAAVPGEIPSEPSRALISQQATPEGEASYFRQVYEDFVELKRKCGESTDGLTYDKFAVKLRQNRDQLVQKYSCKAVKFQVYVKDGKAALKATPVRG
jgi:Double sensory domain of two-component sensor kinase